MNFYTHFFCSFFILVLPVCAQPHVRDALDEPREARVDLTAGSLSLDTVTRAVLEKNPAILSAEKKWNAARERIAQAGAWDDLKVSAESRFARFVEMEPNQMPDQEFSIEQMIPLSGKNKSRARIAAAEALASFEEFRRQKLDVVAKVRTAFFRLVNAREQLEINRRNLVSLKQIAEISRARYSAGSETAATALSAEVEASKLLEARQDLIRAKSDAQSQLNVLMNRDAFAPLGEPVFESDAHFEHSDFSITKLRALTLAHRPEIQIAQNKIAAEKARLELARREWIPDPAVNVRAVRYNAASQAVSEMDVGVSFNVPWLNHAKYSAQNREALENEAAAEQELAREKTEAIGLLRDQLAKIETAHHHIELFRDKVVPQARQAFEASQFSYESGKGNFSEWISAQRNARDLESMAVEREMDLRIAIAELEAIVGAEIFAPISGSRATAPVESAK